MATSRLVAFYIQPIALCEADAARFLGITARKMASLRISGIAKKNAVGSYSVEDLASIVRMPLPPPLGWKNPLDETAAEAKRQRRKTD